MTLPPLVHHPDARGHSKSGCNGRKYGDDDVQDFLCEFFFHSYEFLSYEL